MKKSTIFIIVILIAILFFCSETRGQNLYERVRFAVEGRGITIGINSEKMDEQKLSEVSVSGWVLLVPDDSQFGIALKLNANDTASIAVVGLSIDPEEDWRISALGGVKNSPHGQNAVFMGRISGVGKHFDFHAEIVSADKIHVRSYLAYPIADWVSAGVAVETFQEKFCFGPMLQVSSISNGIEIFGALLSSGKDYNVPQKYNLNAYVGARLYVSN